MADAYLILRGGRRVFFAADSVRSSVRPEWSIADPAVAALVTWSQLTSILNEGRRELDRREIAVEGVSVGATTLTATFCGHDSTLPIVVVESPDSVVVEVKEFCGSDPGGYADVMAHALTCGQYQGTPDVESWESSDEGVATVASTGPTRARVTFVGAGVATITATVRGVEGSLAVTVTADGRTVEATSDGGPCPVPLVVVDCCPGGVPTNLYATFSPEDVTIVLTHDGTNWVGEGDLCGNDVVVTFECSDPNWLLTIVADECEGSDTAEAVSCSPFSWESSGELSETCCDSTTVVVTETAP